MSSLHGALARPRILGSACLLAIALGCSIANARGSVSFGIDIPLVVPVPAVVAPPVVVAPPGIYAPLPGITPRLRSWNLLRPLRRAHPRAHKDNGASKTVRLSQGSPAFSQMAHGC